MFSFRCQLARLISSKPKTRLINRSIICSKSLLLEIAALERLRFSSDMRMTLFQVPSFQRSESILKWRQWREETIGASFKSGWVLTCSSCCFKYCFSSFVHSILNPPPQKKKIFGLLYLINQQIHYKNKNLVIILFFFDCNTVGIIDSCLVDHFAKHILPLDKAIRHLISPSLGSKGCW